MVYIDAERLKFYISRTHNFEIVFAHRYDSRLVCTDVSHVQGATTKVRQEEAWLEAKEIAESKSHIQ